MSVIRLDKLLADAGFGTRSGVKEMIRSGRVCVDAAIIKKGDIRIDTDKQEVTVDGNSVSYETFEYYMLHKPQGVISATTDDHDKTVIDLIKDKKRRDLFPVGRLDKDTEGLLIITNDGQLANRLLNPKKHVTKRYYAVISGIVSLDTIRSFAEGVDIGDDEPTKPAKLTILATDETKGESEIEISITEGRYHQIKRMFEAVGMQVTYLKRLSMGDLELDTSLTPGEYRRLSDEELTMLGK